MNLKLVDGLLCVLTRSQINFHAEHPISFPPRHHLLIKYVHALEGHGGWGIAREEHHAKTVLDSSSREARIRWCVYCRMRLFAMKRELEGFASKM